MDDLVQITGCSQKASYQGDAFPVVVTEKALSKMAELLHGEPELKDSFVRILVKGGGCSGYYHELDFDDKKRQDDLTKQEETSAGDVELVMDRKSANLLIGVTLDYVDSKFQQGFKFLGGDKIGRRCGCGESFSI